MSTTADSTLNKAAIKRKRLGLSCRECKRRKVKCGRQQPVCTRCVEVGHPEQCVYDQILDLASHPATDQSSAASAHTPGLALSSGRGHVASGYYGPRDLDADRGRRRIEELEARLRELERAVDGSSTNIPDSVHSPPSDPPKPGSVDVDAEASFDVDTEQVLIPGSSFKTKFYGASHSASIIAHVDGFSEFLKKVAATHPVLGSQKWLDQITTWHNEVEPPVDLASVDATVHSNVPPEPLCRQLVQNYFKHFEGLYRILHAPSFWRQYNDYWLGQGSSAFAALLLVTISCARCLFVDENPTYDGDCSVARREAARWVSVAEAWSEQQSHKHTTLATLQTKCLLVLSKHVNLIKPKRHYTVTQTLMATAISAGLHRSPRSQARRMSFFDREMRQRLWATIAELDLAACVERGVPSMAASLHGDVGPPSNVRDDDFDEATADEPAVSLDAATVIESTFLRVAAGLRPLRHAVNTLVNNPRKHRLLTQADLNAYHHQIMRRLADLPLFTVDATGKGPLFDACAKLLVHDLLLMLHLPFAFANNAHPAANHARFVCNGSARSIIGLYGSVQAHGFSQMCLIRYSIVRASLCLCLTPPTGAGFDTVYPPIPVAEKLALMWNVFSLFEQRFLSFGWGSRLLWLLIVASCYIDPSDSVPLSSICTASGPLEAGLRSNVPWQTAAADRVVGLFEKVCTYQVNKDPTIEFDEVLFAKYVSHIRQTLEASNVLPDPSSTRVQQTATGSIDQLAFSDLSDINALMHDSVAADWSGMSLDDIEFFGLAES